MKNIYTFVTVLLVGIILFLLHNYNITSSQLSVSQHNLEVAQDSLRAVRLKNNDMMYTINSYILEKKELNKRLDIDNQTIRDLEKKLKSKVAYISNIKSDIIYDSIIIKDTVAMENDILSYNITYNDEWLLLKGKSSIKNNTATTVIDTISIPTPLQVGLTDNYQIWVKSKNPYLNITNIEGAVVRRSKLNQIQKRWSVGLQVGFGMQYGLINRRIDFGPHVGIGINYRLK